MKIELIKAANLTPTLISRWKEIVGHSRELSGPYFRPEFVQAVAAVRGDVEVAVLQDGNSVVGFFPFQRSTWNVARPVGGRLSDYQAVIAPSDVSWRVQDIMHGCRLAAWEFDHILASQAPLVPFHARLSLSRQLDLSGGFEAYLAGRKKAGARSQTETMRKFRKLDREQGGIDFTWNSTDREVFDQLLTWKSEQYCRTGLMDLFRHRWIVDLLQRLWNTQTAEFSGVLSVLKVEGSIAAVHFGMQSGGVLHYWFPAYDPGLSKISPGLILLLLLAQRANEHGISCIDMGKGDEDYKQSFASSGTPIAEGSVDLRPLATTFRRGWSATRDWVKQSPWREPAKTPIRWIRQMREWLELR